MAKTMLGGLPARTLVRLTCGHSRKVKDINAHEVFYCMECDEHLPIDKILKLMPIDRSKKKVEGEELEFEGLHIVK